MKLEKEIRTVIVKYTSELLDNPDKYEIYPTTKFYNNLEKQILKLFSQFCDDVFEECDNYYNDKFNDSWAHEQKVERAKEFIAYKSKLLKGLK